MQPEAVIQGLIDRGMPPHLAYGFAGNFAVESEFNPDLNERAPLIPGSRGGYGLAQWTGPRRLQLEDFAEQRGVPVSDMDMQLDFLMSELQGSENRAWQAIQAAQDPAEAARLVSEEFLRPGIPHLDRRINTALQLAGMEPQTMQFDATGTPQQPRGFLGGIFGGQQRQPDPNAGSPTDPFANLSRAQRTMLGFAALRDAAASLEGRDSNYFSSALGGFEAARERERLRAQGEMANRVNALQSLAQIEALARATGDPALAEFAAAQRAVLLPPSGGVVTPSVTTGATPRVTPAGGAPGAGVVRPADQVRADLDRALDPETGGVDIAGRPLPVETPAPVVEPLPEAAPTPAVQPDVAAPTETPAPQSTRISEAQARFDQSEANIEALISRLPGANDVLILGMAGLPAGVSPQDQTRLQILLQQREDAATELREAREAEAYPLEDVTSARREFTSLPEVRSFAQQTQALGRVVSSAEDPSPAGDLALIFNYMKILDPGSVVREGEFATAQNAGSVDTRVRSLYNRLLEGERLTPVQREDFLDRAVRIYEGAETQYQSLADQYRGFAEDAGLPVEAVIPDFTYAGEIPRSVVPETPEGYSRSEWFDIWQRMTPEEQQAYREAGE